MICNNFLLGQLLFYATMTLLRNTRCFPGIRAENQFTLSIRFRFKMADIFANVKLQKRDGDEYKDVQPAEHLKGKLVVLYFSAHWCPPCRQFTPVLKDFYETLQDADKPIEIVFVSFDRSEADLKSYMTEAHGNWCVVPFGDDGIKQLAEKFGVSGIPALIVLDASGKAVVSNGRGDVTANPPEKTFESWKTAAGL